MLGSSGFAGSYLSPGLSALGYDVANAGFKNSGSTGYSVDLTDLNACRRLMKDVCPEVIVNLVALTDVEKCELKPEEAFSLNVDISINISKVVMESGCEQLIHISTDHVYSGQGHQSEEEAAPINYYGKTKLKGEQPILECGGLVLRTNFFGKGCSRKPNLLSWVLKSLEQRQRINGFTDVYFNPIWACSLSNYVDLAITNYKPGVYNLGTNGGLSKYDFAISVCQQIGGDCDLICPSNYTSVETTVPRPLDMRMNVKKFESTFLVEMPSFYNQIKECIHEEYKF